jgi:dienelactone hydrolase
MKLPILFTLFVLFTYMSEAQQKITFPSSDGLPITADVYGQDKGLPYILLFHQANYSRGEYQETAPKLQKLGYNCMAVDLRSGNEVNYIQNETAAAARLKNLPTEYLDAEKDILAAIEYIKKICNQRIVLLGSSYSASLVLKIAKNNPSISAVLAFSPGEYFPNLQLKNEIAKFDKPVFIASTKSENPSIKKMVSGINDSFITWFVPSKTAGIHGSRALWSSTPESSNCWMQILLFFKQLKK